MKTHFYLIFSLHGLFYGIDTLQVQEIVNLPELTPAVAAPSHIVGVVNLRSKIVPVIDLSSQFGQPSNAYSLNDRVIFLEHQNDVIGVIVNQVHEVKAISSDCIDTQFSDKFSNHWGSQVSAVANLEDELITLLNIEDLFHSVTSSLSLATQNASSRQETCTTIQSAAFSNFSLEEQTILRDRARNLMRRSDTEDSAALLSLAVLQISGECFGIELATVREFTNVHTITPVPCCPAHIIGNINLRGEIVTLVSLHKSLNVAKPGNHQAVVVAVDDITAGIIVDEVLDVVYIHPSTIKVLPTATRVDGQDYSKGIVSYQERTITLLDLPKLLTQNELVVHEVV